MVRITALMSGSILLFALQALAMPVETTSVEPAAEKRGLKLAFKRGEEVEPAEEKR
ncbi:hypothetical protein COCVIDRAFT_32336, partial [Bipolaris victoriae FI3]